MDNSAVESATIPSDDEECMPKIINTVSLQGCSELSFHDSQENGECQTLLYPECEIKEENDQNCDIKTEPGESGLSYHHKDEAEKVKSEKKRLNLTHLPAIKQEKTSKVKPSVSRKDDVVDVTRLALQESLFKTKELFDTLLRVCQDHENAEQMERVVDRMNRAYSATKQEFLGSQRFQNLLEAETEKVNTSNNKPWLNLKLILDELKYNKKSSPKLKLGESEESQDAGRSNDDEPIIECPKKRRHLKKLEKVLRAVNLKIKKLEEREVDWDDEDNSAYCKLDRYRNQFTKIYGKICEIKGKLPDADRPYLRKVSFAGTTYPHINRCIEKFYNKHREFPDFQDIKKLVTLALKQEGIEMQPIKIHSMAAAAFKEFGEMLKRLRQYDDYDVLISYLDQQVDPARDDQQLQDRLNENALLFKKREQEVIDKFAEKESVKDITSGSGDDSDDRPKKKKKILISKQTNSKHKTKSSLPGNLSSSENEDEDNFNSKTGNGDLNSDSDSDSEEKIKTQSEKGKGKALLGKPRIVKRGVKKSSPSKSQLPKTSISSDEESAPGNTKESLTSYLGLQGRGTPNSTATKKTNSMLESDDDTHKVKKPKLVGGSRHLQSTLSVNSDSDKSSKTKVSAETKNNCKTNREDVKINTIADSDSDIEPISVINKRSPKAGVTKKLCNQARKSTGPRKGHFALAKPVDEKQNAHETISDISDSESRTSNEESDSAKKKISDVDLSSDSGDEGAKQKTEEEDDAIVILSEDVIIEEPKPTATKQPVSKPAAAEDSSDSDDICILSQIEVERRTVAPRKTKSNGSTVATSTPNKNSKPLLKRRMSNQSNSGKTKMAKLALSTKAKPTTLPQVINGASRKVLGTRVTKSSGSSGTISPKHIPLIELD